MSDIQMTKGDSTSWDVFVTRNNPTTGLDEPVNLAGAKAWFTAKRTSRDLDADAVVKKDSTTNPSQVTIVAPTTDGKVRISLAPADTVNYEGRWLEYDVQVREADGTVTTVSAGKLELTKQATITSV